jgi:23S rRNA-/tRNA-specific pseudouridylate synthase
MAGIEQITVEDGEAGMRLDRWFKIHYPGLAFGQLQKLLRTGQVRVDGGRVKADSHWVAIARAQPPQPCGLYARKAMARCLRRC